MVVDTTSPADAVVVTAETGGRVGDAEPTEVASIVVLDTCVLLADPTALHAFPECEVVLPLTVIEELDGHKRRLDEVGRAARDTVRDLERLRVGAGGDLRDAVRLPGGGSLRVEPNGLRLDLLAEHGLGREKADNRILAAALGLHARGRSVRVVSSDCALRIKAAQLGLGAEDYARVGGGASAAARPTIVDVDRDIVDHLYSARIVTAEHLGADRSPWFAALGANEGVVLRAGSQSALARRRGRELVLVPTDQAAWDLRPRSKEQRFALDLLLDPAVPVVALRGRAGTGKTILALAAALEQVFEPASARYDRLVVLRPIVSVGRADVGYLPGSLPEKLGPWFEAVVDALVALGDRVSHRQARAMLDGWVADGRLALESVTYLRGRSLQDTFVLVDEAQNLEPLTAKTILTRIGTNAKAVLIGDTTQIDSPWLSERNCALSVVVEALGGSELFGHVALTQGERSPVADLAADLL